MKLIQLINMKEIVTDAAPFPRNTHKIQGIYDTVFKHIIFIFLHHEGSHITISQHHRKEKKLISKAN